MLALARKGSRTASITIFSARSDLLLGLIKLGQGVAVNVLQGMGIDLDTVRIAVEKEVGTGPDQKMIGNIPYTPRVKKVLALASKEAKALNHTYVGTEHILLGLLREGDGVAAKVLKNLDVDIEEARQRTLKELDPNFAAEESSIPPEAASGEKAAAGPEKKGEVKTPALKAIGRDLTEIAKKGDMDPVIGRKNEIERVIHGILCRRTKENNPVLLGEAGVGKTAIVERSRAGNRSGQRAGNFAQQTRHHARPRIDGRRHKISRPVRGTASRRSWTKFGRKRRTSFSSLTNCTPSSAPVRRKARWNASSHIIKPALSRGEMQCVGATTLNEYRKSISRRTPRSRTPFPIP